MSGIFLSHSSQDKPFVIRLAADLVMRGLPVWFDSWEMETGDSLFQRIFDGIDESTFLVLALSSNSVESKWVKRELNAALAKEDKLDHKIILPIKISECNIPLAIADRVYADFTGAYLVALERLEAQLRRSGAADIEVPLSKELIPLRFTRSLYLDQITLQRRFDKIVTKLSNNTRLVEEQVVVVPDEPYEQTKARFLDFFENFSLSSIYSPDLELDISHAYDSARRGEKALIQGVIEIAHRFVATNECAYFSLAVHWYCRLVRNQILKQFDIERQLTLKPLLLTEPPIREGLSTALGAAKLFGMKTVLPCDVFNRVTGENIMIWVDKNSEVGEWFSKHPYTPCEFRRFWTPELMYKVFVPQMLYRHLWIDPAKPLAWDATNYEQNNWFIGLN